MSNCESCPGDKSTNGTGADSLDKCGQIIITRMIKDSFYTLLSLAHPKSIEVKNQVLAH